MKNILINSKNFLAKKGLFIFQALSRLQTEENLKCPVVCE